jgi:hypothetical protein
MTDKKPTYAFDVDGHTVVEGEIISGSIGISVAGDLDWKGNFTPPTKKKERKATSPGWMEQALNEGDGVYRP